MNYKETVDFLFKQLPMFQRVGAAAYKADLETTNKLNAILGNPQIQFPSIHIAGTNGKGSTSNFIASILQEAGFKTALFTSPHLVDYRERIRINGQLISEDFVVEFIEKYYFGEKANLIQQLQPSFFELTFAMAMCYFFSQKVDIAVIEVGMGGRLDSTNTINSILSIITNIGLDHTSFLGSTIEEIAKEKAGIIKPNIPVVIGRFQSQTKDVFNTMAKKVSAPIYYSNQLGQIDSLDFDNQGVITWKNKKNSEIQLRSPLRGLYQIENLNTVLAAIDVLSEMPRFEMLKNPKIITAGIQNVIDNTHFMGRWQILQNEPTIICDTGHNVDGITFIVNQIRRLKFNKLHMVIGMVNDKDSSSILELLPKDAKYYFCQPNIPRAKNASELLSEASCYNLYGNSYSSVNEALNVAKSLASKDDLIFVGGSTFVVAEVV